MRIFLPKDFERTCVEFQKKESFEEPAIIKAEDQKDRFLEGLNDLVDPYGVNFGDGPLAIDVFSNFFLQLREASDQANLVTSARRERFTFYLLEVDNVSFSLNESMAHATGIEPYFGGLALRLSAYGDINGDKISQGVSYFAMLPDAQVHTPSFLSN